MGQLTLIRHGQAHAFAQDSDRLTELGEQQAARLHQYWLRHGTAFTEIYSGTLQRQRHTAEIATAGVTTAPLQLRAAFNEYDAHGILSVLRLRLRESDATFQQLDAAFEAHREQPDRNRYFQRMFEYLTVRWLSGELTDDAVESFAAFQQRIRQELKNILQEEGTGRRVALFTSGGVIGTIVQTVLQAPTEQMLLLNWRVRNASLTEFTFSHARLSLDSFNALPHLDEPALWTYR
jgi:broad specificity phosphatase PhoE